jgi:hypothetical protein
MRPKSGWTMAGSDMQAMLVQIAERLQDPEVPPWQRAALKQLKATIEMDLAPPEGESRPAQPGRETGRSSAW